MLKKLLIILPFLFFTFTFFDQPYAQCDSIGWSNDPSVNLNVSSWGQNPQVIRRSLAFGCTGESFLKEAHEREIITIG